jgi:cytochrome c oxidase assembly protein subunit 15
MKESIKAERERIVFFRFALTTLVAVYFLILVGGIVRSTGSGMGCPDWPKCFGQWVPPADESELPANYKEEYAEKRIQKNVRLARYLNAFGMEAKARQVIEDEMVLEEQDFNKYKTWTEYINRLVGAAIGLLVTATFIASVKYFRSVPAIFWVALAVMLLTGFQGWLGSLVVSTNLLPWMVTVHMLVSFLIVAGLIYLVYRSRKVSNSIGNSRAVAVLLIFCMMILLIQVVFGTQVRENIDKIATALQFNFRETWISQLNWQFNFHRSFSWVVLIIHGLLVWRLWKLNEHFWSGSLFCIIIISIFTGVLIAYLAIPPVLQPIHLLLAFIAFGIQFYLLLLVRNSVGTEAVRR